MKFAIRIPPSAIQTVPDLGDVQDMLGYRFSDPNILLTALTHRSFRMVDPSGGDYERLEFLGDAVLGLVVSQKLYEGLDLLAGDLTKRTSQVVSRAACNKVAVRMGLDRFVRVGPAASVEGTSILSNVIEAVLGAIYMDGGLAPAAEFVRRHFGDLISAAMAEGVENPKAMLNEMFLKEKKAAPTYRVIESSGPDHSPTYVVEAIFDDRVLGRGDGKSKREAETVAARNALKSFLEGE